MKWLTVKGAAEVLSSELLTVNRAAATWMSTIYRDGIEATLPGVQYAESGKRKTINPDSLRAYIARELLNVKGAISPAPLTNALQPQDTVQFYEQMAVSAPNAELAKAYRNRSKRLAREAAAQTNTLA